MGEVMIATSIIYTVYSRDWNLKAALHWNVSFFYALILKSMMADLISLYLHFH